MHSARRSPRPSGIYHIFEEYSGDHHNRLRGRTGRSPELGRAAVSWSAAGCGAGEVKAATGQGYAAIWRGDWLSLLAMTMQALVVALLVGILFGNVDKATNEREAVQRAERSIKPFLTELQLAIAMESCVSRLVLG
jgi:hypothetical protein